jgi:hypothetical protein
MQNNNSPLKGRWQSWCDQFDELHNDILGLFHSRRVWRKIRKMIETNPAVVRTPIVEHWLAQCYSGSQLSAVRRQRGQDERSVSLWLALEHLARTPEMATRAWFAAELKRRGVAPQYLEDRIADFDNFAGPGNQHVDPVPVRDDRDRLVADVEKAKIFTDKVVAHRDYPTGASAQPPEISWAEFDIAIDTIGEIYKKYYRLRYPGQVLGNLTPDLPLGWVACWRPHGSRMDFAQSSGQLTPPFVAIHARLPRLDRGRQRRFYGAGRRSFSATMRRTARTGEPRRVGGQELLPWWAPICAVLDRFPAAFRTSHTVEGAPGGRSGPARPGSADAPIRVVPRHPQDQLLWPPRLSVAVPAGAGLCRSICWRPSGASARSSRESPATVLARDGEGEAGTEPQTRSGRPARSGDAGPGTAGRLWAWTCTIARAQLGPSAPGEDIMTMTPPSQAVSISAHPNAVRQRLQMTSLIRVVNGAGSGARVMEVLSEHWRKIGAPY